MIVYEAGPTGYSLARQLQKASLPIKVVAPSKTPRHPARDSKTDRLDCRTLAKYAAKGLLRQIGIPTKQQGLQPEPDYCETVVEIELQNLRLDQLIDFPWKVEPSKVLVRVKSLYIRKNATNAALLDSVIQTRASGHDFVEPPLFLSKPNLLPANFCTS